MAKTKTPRTPRLSRTYRTLTAATASVCGVFLALSLRHQASSIAAITHAGPIDAWAFGSTTELAYVLFKTTLTILPPSSSKELSRYLNPAIGALLGWSAFLNVHAFWIIGGSTGGNTVAAIWGVFITALVFVSGHATTKLYLKAH